MGVADEDLKRQLHEAWAERDAAQREHAAVATELEAVREERDTALKEANVELPAMAREVQQAEAERDRALELKVSAEELSSARALEVERLKDQLAGFLGPKCEAKECPDYDGAHPYHANAIEKAYEAGQKAVRDEYERLKAEIQQYGVKLA